MKAEDLYEAMQYIRPAFVEESEMKIPNQGKKLPRRILLIAAAVAALGIAGAAAVSWSLRGAARADANLQEPIPEWTEYQIPGETARTESPAAAQAKPQPEPQPEPPQMEHEWEPEGGWLTGITLDSTICSGEKVTAYIRIPNISPEIAAECAKCGGEYYFYIGGHRVEPLGEADAPAITYVSYDEATRTVLLRLDFSNVKNTEEIKFAPMLCRGLDNVGYYDEVTIPVKQSSGLHAEVSIDLPHDEAWGDIRIVAANVYAGYVEVETDVTPFGEVADKERYPDVNVYISEDSCTNQWRDAYFNYFFHQHDSVDAAMADASLLLRDGSSLLITDLPSLTRGYRSDDFEGREEEYCSVNHASFRYETTQVIDLSQVTAITIGGVEYPLQ